MVLSARYPIPWHDLLKKKKRKLSCIFLANEGATRGKLVQNFPFSYSECLMLKKKGFFFIRNRNSVGREEKTKKLAEDIFGGREKF